jgi:hypothetical protein
MNVASKAHPLKTRLRRKCDLVQHRQSLYNDLPRPSPVYILIRLDARRMTRAALTGAARWRSEARTLNENQLGSAQFSWRSG